MRQGIQAGTVVLKNGAEEPTQLVQALMDSLRSLCATEPIAFYELVQLCRNPEHEPWLPSVIILKEHALLEPSGTVHSSIRSIVVSAIEGDEMDMRLVSPYAEEAA